MPKPAPSTASRRSVAPSERLLDAATELFAREGIRAVGIDRILQSANVARASLYQGFGSKDALVAEYLRRQDERDRAAFASAAQGVTDAEARVLLPFDLAARKAPDRGFRGCLYVNAATEFPDGEHPAIAVVREHRAWLAGIWSESVRELPVHAPDEIVVELTVLYDGGLAGSKIDRTIEPIHVARQAAVELLRRRRSV